MPDPTAPVHMSNDAGFDQAFARDSVFDGKYRVERLLGAGAFGRVYLAEDVRIGRLVALKVVDAASYPDHAALLQSELEVMRVIEHGSVVRLYDFGAVGPFSYLCMEYVEGPSLCDLLHEKGRFELRRATSVILQILDALVEAQKEGVAHLDLKPQNVIIARKGARVDVVKLVDFGIALNYAREHRPHRATSGTPLYMAPEQIRNGRIGPYTDVYSVGLVFFELLTGYPAFVESDAVTLMAHKASVSVRLPQGLAPSPVCAVVDRALNRDPELRYPDALAMFDDLRLAATAIKAPSVDPETGTGWRKVPTSSGVMATVTDLPKVGGEVVDVDAETDVPVLKTGQANLPKPATLTQNAGEDVKDTNPHLPLVSMRRKARRPLGRRYQPSPPLGTKHVPQSDDPDDET